VKFSAAAISKNVLALKGLSRVQSSEAAKSVPLEFDLDQCRPSLKLLTCNRDGLCGHKAGALHCSTSENLRPLAWAAFFYRASTRGRGKDRSGRHCEPGGIFG
jgi:hypothetical protein